MKVIFGIVTYHRTERQSMLEYLHKLGYTREEIIVQTQCKEDYIELLGKYEEWATILYKKGSNLCENKNNMLDWICEKRKGEKVVICSDKVRAIDFMGEDGKLHEVKNRKYLDTIVERAFGKCEEYDAELWGLASVGNTFYMSHTMHVNALLLGCFMGIRKPEKWRFDTKQILREDHELTCRVINNGGCIVRFNDIAIRATFHTKGGCHELWYSKGDKVTRETHLRLLALYPNLLRPNPSRGYEVRYVGPSQKMDYSIIKDI